MELSSTRGTVHMGLWTVPRVLVRRTASPEHADFGGLSLKVGEVVTYDWREEEPKMRAL